MTPSPTGGQRAASDPPRRSRVALVTPFAVLAATAALVLWAAWPTVRPVRTVTVTQAVFDRAAEPPDSEDPSTSDRSAPPGPIVQAAGWLEAEPFSVAAAALADGIVERIDVLEGDLVSKGQPIAHLIAEDSELRLAQANAALAAAQAGLALAQAEQRAAQTDWDEPVERERAVAVGKASLAESKAEVAQLPFLIAAARSTLVQYEEELARAERSLQNQAATELEVITARQRLATQRAMVESLEASLPILQARVDRLAAELAAAERNLTLRIPERRALDAAQATVAAAQAELARATALRDEAALELERMTVRAPIDGYIQQRLKMPGDKAVRMMDSPSSAQIAILYDPSRLQARVDVPLADAAHVFVGQRCEVVVEILPDTIFEGVVLRTTHEADLQKNTLQVKVGVRDPSPLLRPEMLTRVKFLPKGRDAATGADPIPNERASLLVPIEALDTSAGFSRLWIVADRRGDRGVLRAVAATTRSQIDGWAEVTADLAPGALLAIATDDLREGEPVRFTARETDQ